MKIIRVKDVLVEYVLILLFAASLVAGVFLWWFFILAGVLLGLYFLWGTLRLRCHWCGSFLNLDRLLYAYRHSYHCPNCGHEITVVRKVNLRRVPSPPDNSPEKAPAEKTSQRA